ncbi:hypothetical protein GCM10022251_49900 [Phytohabitans flavus]|uniref:Uncharacterized protein n=2 Tax=Phytohabitans flavus TaxID=1076124 RepID=A0A6F8XSD3_9ACTN|nr:hypothetical protein Pflav_031540 [Phytohabitans flavus]
MGDVELLIVLVPDPEDDAETGERLARRLRNQIRELDVESVVPASPAAVPPAGAKGVDPLTLGALIVTLSASGGVFVALINTVGAWLGRQTGRHRVSLTIDGDTIELDGATSAQQRQLVEAFLRRHAEE